MGCVPLILPSRDWVSTEELAQITRVLAPPFALLGIHITGIRWTKREAERNGIRVDRDRPASDHGASGGDRNASDCQRAGLRRAGRDRNRHGDPDSIGKRRRAYFRNHLGTTGGGRPAQAELSAPIRAATSRSRRRNCPVPYVATTKSRRTRPGPLCVP